MNLQEYITEAISSRNNSGNHYLKQSDKVGDWIQKLSDHGLEIKYTGSYFALPEVGILKVVDCTDDISLRFIIGEHGFKIFFNNKGELEMVYHTDKKYIMKNSSPRWMGMSDDKSIDMINTLLMINTQLKGDEINEAISSRNNSKKSFELKQSDKVRDWIQKLCDYGLKVEAKSEFSPKPEVGTLSVVDCGDDIILIFIAGGYGFREFFNNRGELKSSYYTKKANIVNNMIFAPKWLYIDDDKSIDMVNTLLNGGEINEAISSRRNSFNTVNADMDMDKFSIALHKAGMKEFMSMDSKGIDSYLMKRVVKKQEPVYFYDKGLYDIHVALPNGHLWIFRFGPVGNLFADDYHYAPKEVELHLWNGSFRLDKSAGSTAYSIDAKKEVESMMEEFNQEMHQWI